MSLDDLYPDVVFVVFGKALRVHALDGVSAYDPTICGTDSLSPQQFVYDADESRLCPKCRKMLPPPLLDGLPAVGDSAQNPDSKGSD